MNSIPTSATGSDEFDYVIVGAGAAGCILAARLTETPGTTVCLLEAGPGDGHPFLAIPAGFTRMIGHPRYTWQFQTEPAAHTGNRSITITQGRTLGGSTSLNGMIFVRGQQRDFDDWRAAGNTGWGWEDVLPFFMRIESRPQGDPGYRGQSGELRITDAVWSNVAIDSFIEAARAEGMPLNRDYNGAAQAGVAITQQTIARGRRQSSSAAFLRPSLSRANLHVRVNACASRVLFSGRRAFGVAYRRLGDGAEHVVRARREVIVSSGTINTARLLQVSGLGDGSFLRQLGVDVVHDLPGVGSNFQDHYLARVVVRGKGFKSINQLSRGPGLLGQVARWAVGLPSILTVCPSLIHFFMNSGFGDGDADLQGIFVPANYKEGSRELDDKPGMTCAVWQHRPQSKGYVRARSPHFAEPPLIQPNYLAEPNDREMLLAGLRRCRRFFQRAPLSKFVDYELQPGPDVQTDDEWLTYAAMSGSTVYHPVGTAKMGPETDRLSVVDHELRVHGIESLRVVDASVMPALPSANTAATTMMIAEKASQLIRGR